MSKLEPYLLHSSDPAKLRDGVDWRSGYYVGVGPVKDAVELEWRSQTIIRENMHMIQINKTRLERLERSLSSQSSSSSRGSPRISWMMVFMRVSTRFFEGPMSFDFDTWILASLRCFITTSASTDPAFLRDSTSDFLVFAMSNATCT